MTITYYTKEGKFEVEYDIPNYNELHRTDGPAIICDNIEMWFINGKQHRLDGPAVERYDESYEYFINDKELNTEEVDNWLDKNKIDLATKEGKALFMLRFA